MNTIKHEQILSHIKRTVSQIVYELDPERFHNVVVTNVLLSNDSKNCHVIVVAPFRLIEELNHRYRHTIARAFRPKYERKIVPNITFVSDDGTNLAMEALIDSTVRP